MTDVRDIQLPINDFPESGPPKPNGAFSPAIKGRGATCNPTNRFERLEFAPDGDALDDDIRDGVTHRPRTEYLRDDSKSIIAYNDSPDIPFSASINPYRGCEHGCAYCYARPTHEYLGMSAGLDFEAKIMVKLDAAVLLKKELSARKWKPQLLAMSGVTDSYQPIERKLEITRACLEVLAEFRNPVGIVTKNYLVTRDIDVLSKLAGHRCACVYVSLTTLDARLARILEPRTSHPEKRLAAIRKLADAGIPVGAMVAPIIPGINDHEIPAILERIADSGGSFASFTVLRLAMAVKPLFESWAQTHFPDRMGKIMARVESMRGGKRNDARFHYRMRGDGAFADQIKQLFKVHKKRVGITGGGPQLSTDAFRRPHDGQLTLFD